MRSASLLLALALTLTPLVTLAHGDHAPRIAPCAAKPCTEEQVKSAVPAAVELLVKMGKIDASWTTAKIEKIEQKEFKKGPEWVTTLTDEKQPEGKKRRYIFITNKGYLNGSNTTGE